MCSQRSPFSHTYAFVLRIWWEPGLTSPNGRPLWRGEIQHAASGQTLVFQSLDDLLDFIQSRTGKLENTPGTGLRRVDPKAEE